MNNNIINRINYFLLKQEKVYFHPNLGEKAPKGTSIHRGPQGGVYYIPSKGITFTEKKKPYSKIMIVNFGTKKEDVERLQKAVETIENKGFLPKQKIKVIRDGEDVGEGGIYYSNIKTILLASDVFHKGFDKPDFSVFNGLKISSNIALIIHEFGHAFMDSIISTSSSYEKIIGNWKKLTSKNWKKWREDVAFVTIYAGLNKDECFAESYLYYIVNPTLLKKVNPDIYNYFEDIKEVAKLNKQEEIEYNSSRNKNSFFWRPGKGSIVFEDKNEFRKLLQRYEIK